MLLIMVGDWPMRRHDHSFVILATRCRISRSDTTVIVVPIQWYPTTGTHSIEREVVFSTSNAQNRVLLLSLLLLSLSTEHRGSCIHAQVYAQCTFLSFVYVCLCVRVFLSRSLFFSTIVCVFPMKKTHCKRHDYSTRSWRMVCVGGTTDPRLQKVLRFAGSGTNKSSSRQTHHTTLPRQGLAIYTVPGPPKFLPCVAVANPILITTTTTRQTEHSFNT